MSRKILRLLAIGLVLGLVAAACSDDSDSGSDDGDSGGDGGSDLALVSDGTLTVCTDSPYEPFEYEEDGEFKGFDVDVVNEAADRMGLDTSYKVTVFDTILASLEAGDCDIVASAMTITDERAEQVNFSDPYFDADQSLLVRSEDEVAIESLENLDGKTVGVQTGTTGEIYAEDNLPAGAEVRSYETGDEMFAPLQAGEIDAVLQDLPVNGYRAVQDDAFVVTAKFSTGEQYGIAVAKSNEALLAALNDALGETLADGTYDEIYTTWFG